MCGILGFIGDSKAPDLTYALTTSLLKITEMRGKESTGFWCTQGGVDGEIMYHKAPITSSKFIELDIWKKVGKFVPNLLIAHCREPSTGVGSPAINSNNHPHVSKTYLTALVHNGRVYNYETLKSSGYANTLGSECDSEILLRMFERGEYFDDSQKTTLKERFKGTDPDMAHRLYGLEQIFLNAPNAHMAVAIAERKLHHHRMLWLWHNAKRPLWILDLRSSLGQYFFCSTPEIWRNALEENAAIMDFLPKDHEMFELSTDKIFLLEYDPTQESDLKDKASWNAGWRTRRYDLESYEEDDTGAEELVPALIVNTPPQNKIVVWTMLDSKERIQTEMQKIHTSQNFIPEEAVAAADDDDDVEEGTDLENLDDATKVKFEKKERNERVETAQKTFPRPDDDEDSFELDELKTKVEKNLKQISEIVSQIETTIANAFLENSISIHSLQSLLRGLEMTKSNLESSAMSYMEI